jgi:probable phosphoglycerate mutase
LHLASFAATLVIVGIFYLIRHAETDWNAQHRLQGHSDTLLNDQGKAQARTLTPWIKNLGIRKIVASDLKRAHETALIASNMKVPVITDPGIREINLGEGEGKTWSEVEPWLGKEFCENWAGNDFGKIADLSFPKGESRRILFERTRKTLVAQLLKSTEPMAFVTHGLLIRTFVHTIDPFLQTSFRMPNTGILPFAFDGTSEFHYLGPKAISEVIVPMKTLTIDF